MHDAVFGGFGQRRHIGVGRYVAKRGLVHNRALKDLGVKSHGFGTVAIKIQIRTDIHGATSFQINACFGELGAIHCQPYWRSA